MRGKDKSLEKGIIEGTLPGRFDWSHQRPPPTVISDPYRSRSG